MHGAERGGSVREYLFLLFAGSVALCAKPACAADALKFGAAPSWVHPQPFSAAPGKNPDAPIALLLKDEQVRFDHGKMTAYSEVAIKYQNAQGLAGSNVLMVWQPATDSVTVNKLQIRRGNKTIDVLAGGQTFTVLRRETNLDAAMLDGTLTATLQPEGLQIGDIIDFATTTEHSDPVLKSHVEAMFGAWDGLPIETAHAALSWPSNFRIQVRATPNLPPLQKSSDGGITRVEISAHDVQPLIEPNGAPQRFKIGRLAEATDFNSWSDLANLFIPLFKDAAIIPASGPLHHEVEKIRSATSNPKLRAEQALTLVQDRVRYVALLMGQGGYVPASAETTWSRRFGDCKAKTALLLGILHSLGIEAEPVVVQVQLGDMVADRLPMVSLFNHVLVRAHIAGKEYWLDGTRSGDSNLDSIEVPDFAWGLPLVPNSKLVRMVPPPLIKPRLERHIRIDATTGVYAPATITIEELYRGDSAVDLNAAYSAVTPAQRDVQMHEDAKGYFDTFASTSSAIQFDKAKRELLITIKGTAKLNWKDGWFYVPSSSIGFDPDFDRTAGPLHDVPMAISHPLFTKDVVEIKLPEGFAALQKLDPDVHETLAGVEYARSERVVGNTLTVESSERSLVPEVPYKDALASAARLKAMSQDDVYLRQIQGYRQTAADFAALAEQQPTSAAEFIQRGSQYLEGAKYDQALADFAKAVELEPKNEEAIACRALTYVWQGKYGLAQADMASAEAINPRNAVLLRARGLLAESRGEYSEAIDFYTRSLVEDPHNGFALIHRAGAHANLGESDQALTDYNEAVQYLGDTPSTRIGRLEFELDIGHVDEARKDLDAALKGPLTPAEAAALAAARGRLAERSGDVKTAAAAYSQALQLNSSNAGFLLKRAEAYRASGDLAKALTDTDAALKANYKGMDLRLLRANIFYGQGDRAAAAKEANLAVSEHPDSEYAYVLAGKVFAKIGMNGAAMKAFDRALELNPAAYVYVNRAQVRPPSDVAGQMADYDAALKLEPKMPEALSLKALLFSKQGKYAEALALYEDMGKAGANMDWIETQRAVLLTKAGKTAEAAKSFDELRSKAKSPSALNSLCWAEGTAGVMLAEAVQECSDAVKLSDHAAQYVDSLGMALLKSGKLDEALAAYNEAIGKTPLAASYMGRAIIYARKGEKARADADFAKAKKLDPDIGDRFADYGLQLDTGPNAKNATGN